MSDERCIIITVLSFAFFMIIHHIVKPSYIYKRNENNQNETGLSPLQLNLIYSLMFASSLGILCLFVEIIRNQMIGNKENKENQSVEPPSFK